MEFVKPLPIKTYPIQYVLVINVAFVSQPFMTSYNSNEYTQAHSTHACTNILYTLVHTQIDKRILYTLISTLHKHMNTCTHRHIATHSYTLANACTINTHTSTHKAIHIYTVYSNTT